MEKPDVIVICGPTASGKTALSIELAKKINSEIVSADSMLIYKYMNIGVAKPTLSEMQGIKHYMIDIVEPNERFSVADYKKQAEKCIDEIISNKKIPIVVGGTGLYIDSLIYGIEYNETKTDMKYRAFLEELCKKDGLDKLYNMALEIDPDSTRKVSRNDKKRIMRIIEIFHETGKTKTEQEVESRKKGLKYNYHVYAINWDRESLYNRINIRVDKMINDGLIDEVKFLLNKYPNMPTAIQGLGYKEIKEYLQGKIAKDEAVEKVKTETRRYAKRQFTWFKKNKETIWIEGNDDIQKNIDIILRGIN